MSVNVYDIANELERGIRNLPEYKAVAAAKEKISGDKEAQDLWKELQTAQEQMQTMMMSGKMPSAKDQKRMNELGEKLEKNPILKSYLQAQQALSVYITDIERIVFSPLKDLAE